MRVVGVWSQYMRRRGKGRYSEDKDRKGNGGLGIRKKIEKYEGGIVIAQKAEVCRGVI